MRDEEKKAFFVYAVTAAMLPLTISAFVFFLTIGSVIQGSELTSDLSMMAISIGANAVCFAGVALFLAMYRTTGEEGYARLGWVSSRLVDHLAAVIGLLGLTVGLDAAVQLAGLGNYGRIAEMRDTIMQLSLKDRVPLMFLMAFGAGIPEELFFRGFIFRRLASLNGARSALIVSALLFGLFHLDPLHSPLAAAMGFFLGYVAMKTGSIIPAISAHVFNNAVAVMTMGLEFEDAWLVPVGAAGMAVALGAILVIGRGHRGEQPPIVW